MSGNHNGSLTAL